MRLPSPRAFLRARRADAEHRAALAEQRVARAEAHRRMLAHYRTLVARGDLVFDVGANVGDRTAAFLELGARVVAVEPQARCVQALRERFDDAEPLVIVERALARTAGTYPIRINEESTISSMSDEWISAVGHLFDTPWVREESVAATTLDDLLARHGTPRFCKIDVEGYEPEVLAGLSYPMRLVSLEFHRRTLDRARRCLDRLADLGASEFAVSFEEALTLSAWCTKAQVLERLEQVSDMGTWGDLYARWP